MDKFGGAERSFRLGAGGISLAALEWRNGTVPLIALHGWLDNAASFRPLAPLLDDTHLIALELPGHGHSDHLSPCAHYHLADNIAKVAAVADQLGWQHFFLLGHSMGGAVATLVAAALPGRVRGLLLIDNLGPLAFTPEQEVARLQRLFAGEENTTARPIPSLAQAVELRQRLSRFPIDAPSARLLVERGTVAVDGGYRWRHDPKLKRPTTHYYCEAQVEAILNAIACDTLLVSGSEGAFAGWEALEAREAAVPRLTHIAMAGGHHLHMAQAAEVSEPLCAFLRQEG